MCVMVRLPVIVFSEEMLQLPQDPGLSSFCYLLIKVTGLALKLATMT